MRIPILLALTAAAAFAEMSHHIVQLRPEGDRLMIVETFIWKAGPAGSVKLYIPAAGLDSVQSGDRKLLKTSRPNVYEIKVPMTGKDIPVQVAYQVPSAGGFTGKSLQPDAPTRFLVPRGLQLSGKNIERRESPPGMNGVVYAATAADYSVKVEGSAEPEPEAPAAADKADNDTPNVERILPRIYDRMDLVLGISFAILALGFILLYRRTAK